MAEEEQKLSRAVHYLLEVKALRSAWEAGRAGSPHIQVNSLVGIFPFLYERVRTLVEFPDEHLVQRRAIERILRRRFAFCAKRGDEIIKAFLN